MNSGMYHITRHQITVSEAFVKLGTLSLTPIVKPSNHPTHMGQYSSLRTCTQGDLETYSMPVPLSISYVSRVL